MCKAKVGGVWAEQIHHSPRSKDPEPSNGPDWKTMEDMFSSTTRRGFQVPCWASGPGRHVFDCGTHWIVWFVMLCWCSSGLVFVAMFYPVVMIIMISYYVSRRRHQTNATYLWHSLTALTPNNTRQSLGFSHYNVDPYKSQSLPLGNLYRSSERRTRETSRRWRSSAMSPAMPCWQSLKNREEPRKKTHISFRLYIFRNGIYNT